MRVRYDNARAEAALAKAGIAVTPLTHYFERLVDYAVAARWGRTPSTRAELLDGAGPGREAARIAPARHATAVAAWRA